MCVIYYLLNKRYQNRHFHTSDELELGCSLSLYPLFVKVFIHCFEWKYR